VLRGSDPILCRVILQAVLHRGEGATSSTVLHSFVLLGRLFTVPTVLLEEETSRSCPRCPHEQDTRPLKLFPVVPVPSSQAKCVSQHGECRSRVIQQTHSSVGAWPSQAGEPHGSISKPTTNAQTQHDPRAPGNRKGGTHSWQAGRHTGDSHSS